MTTVAGLEALRAKAGVQEKADAMEQFRADFALVYDMERLYGYANEDEAKQMRFKAGRVVQERMGDEEWMAGAQAHFAQLADTIRRDQSRAERIRAEVRADKQRRAA